MSQENVEIVRRAVEAFLNGARRMDFSAAWDSGAMAVDAEMLGAPEVMERGNFIGRDGFIEFMHMWTEEFDGWSVQFERLIDAGNDRVVGFFRQSATGRRSRVRVEQPYLVVYDVRDGQLVRLQAFNDRDEALEAARLRE